ncbi:MAG: hypothetical protein E6I85_04625 [Chloroflexi bacterium]|nr:MAG: hypothetical protein E6I85_04625 [Chloroflexota bacterium]
MGPERVFGTARKYSTSITTGRGRRRSAWSARCQTSTPATWPSRAIARTFRASSAAAIGRLARKLSATRKIGCSSAAGS